MKTNFLILGFCCFFSASLYGQKYYLKADFGYGIGVYGSDYITAYRTYNITLDTTTYYDTYDNKKISFGTGIYPGISFGYMINKYFSFETNFVYFKEKSKIIKTKDQYNIVYGYSSYATYQSTYKGKSLYLIPNLMFSPGFENVNPYIKLGFVFGKSSMKIENDNLLYNAFSGSTNPFTHALNEWVLYGGLFSGIKSTTGVEIYFDDMLKLFFELSYNSVSYTPVKAKIKNCTLDGVDQLPGMTVSDKEIEFVETYTTNTTPDPSKPRPELKTIYNYNALFINLGVKIFL